MSTQTRQNELVIHLYNGKSTITFFEGVSPAQNMEFAIFQFGDKKRRYVFSYGLVNRLKTIISSISELEMKALTEVLHILMTNSHPLSEGYEYINDLHKEGFPSAAEAIDLAANFYERIVDDSDLSKMKAIVTALG